MREADVAVAVGSVGGDGEDVVFLGGLEGGKGVRGGCVRCVGGGLTVVFLPML